MHKPLVNHVLFRPKASRRSREIFFKHGLQLRLPLALRNMKILSSGGKGFVYKRIVYSRTNRGRKGKTRSRAKHLSSGKESGARMSRRERKEEGKERGERRKVSEGSFVSPLDLMPHPRNPHPQDYNLVLRGATPTRIHHPAIEISRHR